MFKHLLVPLDGSRLAEAALPAAACLAEYLGASITLIHIIERDASGEIHGERHLTTPANANAYLEEVARRALPADIHVARHVHTVGTADLPQSILDHVEELAPDLIVMCTHGSGGLRDFLFGNIAQQVIARGNTPVLLIRPKEKNVHETFAVHRLLVPLDGDPAHAQGLPVAADLARLCGAELFLVFVVPTTGTLSGQEAATGRLLPSTMRAVLDLAQQDAAEYLAGQMTALQETGLTVKAAIRRGDPATAIVEAADAARADLIVLGTHGKAGMDAFWAGSISPKISGRSKLPLLLVPVAGHAK
jgi:nucleotide-binding universal stress UspA family protein